MRKLVKYFLQGLVFMVPIALTIYIFYIIFVKIDGLITIPVPGLGVIPGLGFLTTVLLMVLIGFLVSNFLTKKLMMFLDQFFKRLPLIKLIYNAIKDLLNAFVGEKKSFSQPVLIKLTQEGPAHVLGFITCESLSGLTLDGFVSVYVPQSYNFAGQVLIFPREQVRPLPISSTEAMAFIVSGGVSQN